MEPEGKIDIKSERYRAAVPYITRLAQASLARYRELPKGDIAKNFVILYLAVGFIMEGIAGAAPAMALSLIGVQPGIVGFSFFVFWPAIGFFVLGQAEHTILSLMVLFIGATYISHLKQHSRQWQAATQGPTQGQLAPQFARAPGLVTGDTVFTSAATQPVEGEIIPPQGSRF